MSKTEAAWKMHSAFSFFLTQCKSKKCSKAFTMDCAGNRMSARTSKYQNGISVNSFCSLLGDSLIRKIIFSRKLSELGSRLGFGVQGLGRGVGAAAGQKWSFRVRRMFISLVDGVPGPIPFPWWFQGGPRAVSRVFEVSSKGLKGIRKESK